MKSLYDKTPVEGAPSPILLTEECAARVLSISSRSLWALRDAGQMPHVRIGKTIIRYRFEDLVAFAAQHLTTKKAI